MADRGCPCNGHGCWPTGDRRLIMRCSLGTRRSGRRWLAKCGAAQTGPRAAPALLWHYEGRGFACLLAQLPIQLPSCRRSERAAATGIGFLREVTKKSAGPPDKSIEECMAIMSAKRVRHLPVTDDSQL